MTQGKQTGETGKAIRYYSGEKSVLSSLNSLLTSYDNHNIASVPAARDQRTISRELPELRLSAVEEVALRDRALDRRHLLATPLPQQPERIVADPIDLALDVVLNHVGSRIEALPPELLGDTIFIVGFVRCHCPGRRTAVWVCQHPGRILTNPHPESRVSVSVTYSSTTIKLLCSHNNYGLHDRAEAGSRPGGTGRGTDRSDRRNTVSVCIQQGCCRIHGIIGHTNAQTSKTTRGGWTYRAAEGQRKRRNLLGPGRLARGDRPASAICQPPYSDRPDFTRIKELLLLKSTQVFVRGLLFDVEVVSNVSCPDSWRILVRNVFENIFVVELRVRPRFRSHSRANCTHSGIVYGVSNRGSCTAVKYVEPVGCGYDSQCADRRPEKWRRTCCKQVRRTLGVYATMYTKQPHVKGLVGQVLRDRSVNTVVTRVNPAYREVAA